MSVVMWEKSKGFYWFLPADVCLPLEWILDDVAKGQNTWRSTQWISILTHTLTLVKQVYDVLTDGEQQMEGCCHTAFCVLDDTVQVSL